MEITQIFAVNKTNDINTNAIKTIVILQARLVAWVISSEGPLEELTNLAKTLPATMAIMAISTEHHRRTEDEKWAWENYGRDMDEWDNVPCKEQQVLRDQVLNQDENLVNLNIGGLILGEQSSKTMLALFPHCNNWSVGVLSMDVWEENQILDLDTALGTRPGCIHQCHLNFDNQQDNQKVEKYLETFRKVWEVTQIISLSVFFDFDFGDETKVAGGRGPNSDPEVVWQTFVDELLEHIQIAQDN